MENNNFKTKQKCSFGNTGLLESALNFKTGIQYNKKM